MTTMQFALFDDEPMVAVTAKGKRVAPKLKPQAPTAPATPPAAPSGAGNGAAKAAHTQKQPARPTQRPASLARPTAQHHAEVPIGPAAQLAVNRIAPLQPVVRVALLEMLAVAAIQEAEAQRAVLSAEAYPFAVTLNVEMLSNGVEGVLNSPALLQAIALNVLCASVPDEPIPEPSKEYLDYLAAEEARKAAQAAQPAAGSTTTTSTTSVTSTPQTSQQPADQFGMDGGALTWPEQIPAYGKPFKDGKSRPIAPLVLLVGSRDRTYQLPKLALASVQYATSQQIRVKFVDAAGTERGIMQDGCYCVPTQTHLQQVVERFTAYQTALTNLATLLRDIGTYAQRLREACDIEDGKTPPTSAQLAKLAKHNAGLERLCDQVICAPEPDKRMYTFNDPFKLPDVSRGPIFRHTPLSYQKYQGSATISQIDTFPCADNETWERVDEAVKVAAAAQKAWVALLAELGTYKVAANEQRYAVVDTALAQAALSTPAVIDVFSDTDDVEREADTANEAGGEDSGDDDSPVGEEAAIQPDPNSFAFEELAAAGEE